MSTLPARERGGLWTFPVTILPRVLREPRRPGLALLAAWMTALLPSLVIAAIIAAAAPDAQQPEFGGGGVSLFLMMVLFAPIVETLIMAAVLSLLLRVLPPTAAVLASAAAWGVAHSLAAPVWGLVIWWPFLVFSTLFITWRERSWLAGAGMAAAAHGLQNSIPAGAILLGVTT